jgi:acyl-CoA thioesterase
VGNAFLEGTAVESSGDGGYHGHIDAAWSLRPLPQGGFVTAMALRAMAAELDDPGQRLRTLHTTFAAQVTDGPVEIDVELLRRGRSMSQLRAEVRNPGAERGHLTTAVFGSPRRGFGFTDLRPPAEIPRPEDCASFRDPLPPGVELEFEPMPFWDELLEARPFLGHPPWEDYVPDRAEEALWYRFDQSPWLDDGQLDPFALVVMADTMPGAAGEKVGRDVGRFFSPSVDLTVHLLAECRSPWVLAHATARHAGDGYCSGDLALWDLGPECRDEPRLVAYATQVYFFVFPP